MSNAKTGIFSAIGALFGGVIGAYAGKYAAEARPRTRRGPEDVEDAMVVGGATGAVIGAFAAGTIAGETACTVQQLPAK